VRFSCRQYLSNFHGEHIGGFEISQKRSRILLLD
jgi:hypothetical protein